MVESMRIALDSVRWGEQVTPEVVRAVERLGASPTTGVVVQVPNGEIVGANSAACELLGLSWEAVMGRTSIDPRWAAVSELGYPLPGEQHPAMLTLADGVPISGFLMGVLIPAAPGRRYLPGGSTRWIEVDTQPLYAESRPAHARYGPPDAVAALFTDVSDSVRARRATDALLNSFRLLGEAAPGLVLRVDAAGRVVQAAAVAGIEPRSIQGERVVDRIHPDDRQRFEDFWSRLVREVRSPHHVECRWRTVEGDYRVSILQVNPIYDADGAVSGAALGLQDVHDIYEARVQLAELQLDQQRVLAELAINGTGLATWDWNLLTGEITVNERWAEIIGYSLSELGHTTVGTWREHAHAGDAGRAEELLRLTIEGALPHYEIEMRRRHRDGHWVWVRDFGGVTERDEQGRAVRMSGLHEDISARVQAQESLAASERHYRLLAAHMSDAVWVVAPDGRVSWTSESTTALLGWPVGSLVGQAFVSLVHPDDRAVGESLIADADGFSHSGECRVACQDDGYRSLAVRAAPSDDGSGTVVALHDIQSEVAAREALAEATMHDSVTGLANRERVVTSIGQALANLAESWQPEDRSVVAVMVAGIDGLTTINDALTHAAGDHLIREVGRRLQTQLGTGGCLGRGSGDEFLVVIDRAISESALLATAEQLRLAVKGPVILGAHEAFPSVSLGIATAGVGADPDEVLRDAAAAMRSAKAQGRDRIAFFKPDQGRVAQQHLRIENEIRRALPAGELRPWFQPIVDLESERVVGFEALVRWVKPDGTVVPPGAFLPVAEDSPVITMIDRAIVRQAIATLAEIDESLTIAVNVSGRTLGDATYFTAVEDLLGEFGVAAARLHLEVTETTLPGITETSIGAVERLAALGVAWYADDFGTGYSSIAVLRELPIRGIKLDRSFTHQLGEGDATSEQLARAIAALAEELGLDAVAEGVETSEEASVLLGQGWRRAQGWLFGRPEPRPRLPG
jgi:diguanylate cyclase (GGDEF)-like protein/PAS domain S-box-containing protein